MESRPDWSPAQQRALARLGSERVVDVHCHCLPGIDDGPAVLEESIALCQALVEDGVTSVVATPHQLGGLGRGNPAEVVRQSVAELAAELDRLAIPLELTAGGDVRIDERLLRFLEDGEIETVGGLGTHLLLELPFEFFVDPLPLIDALGERGIQAVMTHPERHRYLAGHTTRIADWVEHGAVVQVTSGSLLGDFGRSAHAQAWALVDAGLVGIVASDAHDAEQRPPRLTPAVKLLAEQIGPEYAQVVCGENPCRVWRGETISPAG